MSHVSLSQSAIARWLLQRWKKSNIQGLRVRLYVYLTLFVLLLLLCAVGLLGALDIVRLSPRNFTQQMQGDLERYSSRLSTYFGTTAAQGLRFSQLVSDEVEKTLTANHASFAHVTDNPELIRKLEENTYSLLRDALLITECSGAFIIFDATVNSSLPSAQMSRCGTYLRLANISNIREVNPEFVWIRGIHSIGASHGHTFHNKWELEFSLSRLPFYKILKGRSASAAATISAGARDGYFYSSRVRLPGTWESMMLLCVPIIGSEGQFYGLCGFEVSALFFKLAQAIHAPRDAKLTGLVAYRRGNFLLPGTGLESGTSTGYYAEILSPLRVVAQKPSGLTTYVTNSGAAYVGFEKSIQLSPLDKEQPWVVALLVPQSVYTYEIYWVYLKIALFCLAFLLLALSLSYALGRIYIKPIVAAIESIKKGEADKTSYVEIDDLIEFLSRHDTQPSVDDEGQIQPDFERFQQNVATLSPAERAVFNLYLEGYTAQEIADLLFISINTVKSHNRRIYAKLEISSRKELLVYAKLLKLKDADAPATTGA